MGCGQTYQQPFVMKDAQMFIATTAVSNLTAPEPERREVWVGWLTRAARAGAKRRGIRRG